MIEKPIVYIVVPCYNEEEVLPVTTPMFKEKVKELSKADLIDERSRILFVNDGSKDRTWDVLSELCQADPVFCAIKLSRNRGHQNALLQDSWRQKTSRISRYQSIVTIRMISTRWMKWSKPIMTAAKSSMECGRPDFRHIL